MLSKYEQEQAELKTRMDALRPVLERANEETQSTAKFLRLVKAHTEIKNLDCRGR